jgi:acyl transferase domain-containing protein/acyl carrier protein
MIDFIEYVVSELKNKRLSKGNALSLIKQFSQNSSKTTKRTAIIHPLLHTNTSDLYQQSYSTVLNGEEHFLEDHQVKLGENNSARILPGAAYLEMATAAINNALPKLSESSILELKNIVWLTPFFVTENRQINIALSATEDDKVLFEIYSFEDSDSESPQEIIHCEGEIHYFDKETVSPIDIENLKAQNRRGELTSESIYAAYNSMGLLYGPSHQVISAVYQGENQLIAKLSLPDNLAMEQENYVMHPGLLDGALQSSLGLLEDLTNIPDSPRMPFALEKIKIISACTNNMYAWVRYSPGSKATDRVTKLDIDICDSDGNVCLQLKGFTSKAVSADVGKLEMKPEAVTPGELLAEEVWQLINEEKLSETKKPDFVQTKIVMFDFPEIDPISIEKRFSNCSCSMVNVSSEKNIAEKYQEIALYVFRKVQDIIKNKPTGRVHLQIVISNSHENEVLAGISGMLKTAALENPLISGQLILSYKNQPEEELIKRLHHDQTNPFDVLIKYDSGKRYVKKLKEIENSEKQADICFKEQGVYLITGGLGGLGILFAEEILKQTKAAKIILTGRSELNADKNTKFKALANNNNRIEYLKLDLLNPTEVKKCIDDIIKHHKNINGIIHSAGMISDNYILKKTNEEFIQVLEPKVTGTFNLREATSGIDLDFMVLFSSGVAVLGNPGQADYAVANGFLDQFAIYINGEKDEKNNNGKLYSINWPLWQNGGMVLDEGIMDKMKQETGIYPLQASKGIQAFYQSLLLNKPQTLVIEGDLKKVRQLLFTPRKAEVEINKSEPVKTIETVSLKSEAAPNNLLEKTRAYLRKQFSGVLKIPVHKIETSAALEKYGIDSVVAMNLTGQLEKTFGTLSKTLFFEYQTIDELSEYISNNFQDKLIKELALSNPVATSKKAAITPVKKEPKPTARIKARRRFYQQSHDKHSNHSGSFKGINNEPIAIVGLSGRYPESENIQEFWNNLRDGKDCITEVPEERWDWREYYDENNPESNIHTSKWGGFIKGVDEFDPRFFNISPREASYIDPQERLFLQHAWMAAEDAGFTRASLQIPYEDDQNGQVGVYVGVMYGEYNLSGSLASIANRVSYFLNLHGPSMTLDTMCSSSLTAIHLACQDLKLGRTSLAIAGGVNVSIDSNKYRMLSSGQFISSDGHCQSFGEGGDGYIPGEGVGAIILKRLSDAEKDKNHIYGIIKGSALNHGGKTNGYTVPNPIAQASAISRALRESGTEARHVSFVEAHGTGTKLGDPIEIAALTKAYKLSGEERSCLIGSSKSNIGHCESAAGIAGLTKVLLQMKYQQIVPSLHSERLNPNIDFQKTPFEVNQKLQNWERPIIDGKQIPRIAGLSSFGAGGSNAHIILQEYSSETKDFANQSHDLWGPSAIVILSARNAEQLKQKAIELYKFLNKNDHSKQTAGKKPGLFQLAYTLQLGREAMDERLAFVVTSIEQLSEKLDAYINNEPDIDEMYRGHVKENKETISLFNTDSDFQETIDKWILQKKFSKITDLWVKGLELNWGKFYGQEKLQMVSLPTYPFAKEKYWNTPELRGKTEIKQGGSDVLHPLLHKNTSNLDAQKFSTAFSGDEFFIKDYQLKLDGVTAQRALASLAVLEMARVAVETAKPSSKEAESFELREITWGKPFILNGNKEIDVTLFKEDDQQIDFEIFSESNGEEIIHSQGQAVFGIEHRADRINLESVKNYLSGQKLEANEIYQAFNSMGLYYGKSYQVIEVVYPGVNQVLVQLSLPQTIEKTHSEFVLHPAILESIMQASICLASNFKLNNSNLFIPVSANSVTVRIPCNKEMLLWVRYAQNYNSDGNTVFFDADLCDAQGNVCSQIKGLGLKPLELGHEAQTSLQPSTSQVAVSNKEKPNAVQLSSFINENANFKSKVSGKPTGIKLIDFREIDKTAESKEAFEIKKVSLGSLEASSSFSNVVDDVIREAEFQESKSFLPNYHSDESTYKEESSEPFSIVEEPPSIYSKEKLKQVLINTLADALYLDASEIDADKSFIDLGLDSIVGVEWIKTINKKLALDLSSTKIYDYATVNALAKFLEGELKKDKSTPANTISNDSENGKSKSKSLEHTVNEFS